MGRGSPVACLEQIPQLTVSPEGVEGHRCPFIGTSQGPFPQLHLDPGAKGGITPTTEYMRERGSIDRWFAQAHSRRGVESASWGIVIHTLSACSTSSGLMAMCWYHRTTLRSCCMSTSPGRPSSGSGSSEFRISPSLLEMQQGHEAPQAVVDQRSGEDGACCDVCMERRARSSRVRGTAWSAATWRTARSTSAGILRPQHCITHCRRRDTTPHPQGSTPA